MQIRIRDDSELRQYLALLARSQLRTAGLQLLVPDGRQRRLSGLTTETTYHYRVVVHNANGVKYGEDQVYTPHHVLGLDHGGRERGRRTGATLNGAFVGNGEETHYYFEWGPTAAYGQTTAPPPAERRLARRPEPDAAPS